MLDDLGRRVLRLLVVAGVLLAALACSACRAGDPAAHEGHAHAVTGGIDEDGEPTVAALLDESGGLACTATLVAPRLLLTAAHCVRAGELRVSFAPAPSAAAPDGAVVAALVHPEYDAATRAHDLALVVLDAPRASPVHARAADAPAVNAAVDLVGYGHTVAGDPEPARKRRGRAQVAARDAGELALAADPSLPCHGDSGGPVLAEDGALAGVVSGGDPGCAEGARAMRADQASAHGAWIAATIAALADGAAGPGERCWHDANCAPGAGACTAAADDPRLGFCAPACLGDEDCPAGLPLVCAGGRCAHLPPSPGALGSDCAGAADCASGLCAVAGCSERCFADVPASCPDGYACASGLCRRQEVEGAGCAAAPGASAGHRGLLVLLALLSAGKSRGRAARRPSRTRR